MPRTRPIRRPALAVLALALVAPVAQALPSAAATPSAGRGDEIVLVDKTSGPGTTCSRLLRGVIGGEVKEIAASCGTSYFYRPQLSPDGQLIAMESNLAPGGSLNVVDRNGQGARPLTPTPIGFFDGRPAWTPDGARILFTRFDIRGRGTLLTVPSGGGDPTVLSFTGSDADIRDDNRVVYSDLGGRLVTFPLDGGGPPDVLGVQGQQPSWSPDGSEIAYLTGSQLRIISADGSNDRALGAVDEPGEIAPYIAYPRWLPDGESLTFSAGLPETTDSRGRQVEPASEGIFSVDRLGHRAGPVFGQPVRGLQQFEARSDGPAAAPVSGAGAASRFVPVEPIRAYDSRFGQLPATGQKGRLGGGQSVPITLPGAPAGATAAVLNVTVVQPSESTYVTAHPTGSPAPLASNVNVPAAGILPNSVTVKLGPGASVSLFNAVGTTDLVVDVAGYYVPAGTAGPTSTGFAALDPRRVYDSRPAESPQGGPKGALGPGEAVDVPIAGAPGTDVPIDATAVVLNITGVFPSSDTLLRAYPTPATGNGVPLVSNLNLPPGAISANLAVVKIGHLGQVRLRNDLGSTDAVLDIAGYYSSSAPGQFVPIEPQRFLDTRTGAGSAPVTLGQGQFLDLRVGAYRGIPTSATAVAANLTGVSPDRATLLRAYPAGSSAVPTVSNLNLFAGDVRANAAFLVPDSTGRVRLRNDLGGIHVLTDLAGYFVPAGSS